MILETSFKNEGQQQQQYSGLLKHTAVNFSFPIETVYRIQMLK